MNRFHTLIIIFICISPVTIAQKKVVSGVVKDSISHAILESATVSVFAKDSSIITYQLSDKFGGFELKDIPLKDSLWLNVTYVGYQPYNKLLTFDSSHYLAVIFLSPSFNDSQTVTVVSHVPVRMNGDTLEINPAAFKLDPNAVVEDLLAQVPGITIWADGTITMNGRKVPSVLVDGKPFTGSTDARLATQNLPKDAIDKIQVYQEVDRSVRPDERRAKDSSLTMNIKLKEDKKTGYFGKASFGYGTGNRYESDLSFQLYNKKTSFGIGGGYNNINKSISNLNELFQNNTYRNYNPNLYYVGNFNTNGINKYHSIGGVFTHNFIETTNSRQNDRITVNYVKSGNENYLTNLSQQNRTTLENPQFVKDNSTTNGKSSDHALSIRYIKTNSYNDNFTANANANISRLNSSAKTATDVWDTLNNLQSSNAIQNNINTSTNSQSIATNYSKNNSENPLEQFWVNLSINNNNSVSNRLAVSRFTSYIESSQNSFYNRHYYSKNNQFSANANLVYNGFKRLLFGRYNLFGVDLSLVQWLNYNKSNETSNVGDFDSASHTYIKNAGLTYNNLFEKLEYSPNIKISKNIFKWNEKRYRGFYFNVAIIEDLKNERNTSSISERNLSRSFSFFSL